jgi:hypothetical protein
LDRRGASSGPLRHFRASVATSQTIWPTVWPGPKLDQPIVRPPATPSGERHRIVLNDEPTLRCPSRSRASSGRRSRKGPPDRPGSAFHRSGEMDAAPVRHSPSPASTSGRSQPIFITSDAVEFLSQSAPATVLRNHPGTFHVWRIMAHVLIMSAFQLRHPVTFFVQMKSSDLSPHCRRIAPSQMVLWLILAAVIKRRLRPVRGV